jgi:FAD/FMN-containing dehydrogenase
VPPGVSGYTRGKGCSIGGMPQYIVDASSEDQIAKAMAWASDRNLRIVIKSTGHDLSGRYAPFL